MRFWPELRSWFYQAGVFLIFCFMSSAVSAQTVEKQLSKLRPFSADQIRTVRNKTTTGKVYFTQNAMRIESTDKKGDEGIQIMRFDKKVMWMLMPTQKMYLEMPWENLGEWATWADQQGVQRESLGSEQVGDYHCDKYRVHVTLDGKTYTSLEWDAKELEGLPVKVQDENGTWITEYTSVKLGPQDPSLFEVPEGYQKMGLGGMQMPRP